RRLFHQTLCPDAALKFRSMQIKRAHEMIVSLIDDPNIIILTSQLAMSAVHGYKASARDDPLVRIVQLLA
ncbi:hypothetical protein BDR07DRAFT_1272992, partial [Suillus spraguei]